MLEMLRNRIMSYQLYRGFCCPYPAFRSSFCVMLHQIDRCSNLRNNGTVQMRCTVYGEQLFSSLKLTRGDCEQHELVWINANGIRTCQTLQNSLLCGGLTVPLLETS